jgi:hypothetical protein
MANVWWDKNNTGHMHTTDKRAHTTFSCTRTKDGHTLSMRITDGYLVQTQSFPIATLPTQERARHVAQMVADSFDERIGALAAQLCELDWQAGELMRDIRNATKSV